VGRGEMYHCKHVPLAPVPKQEAGDVSKVTWGDQSSQPND